MMSRQTSNNSAIRDSGTLKKFCDVTRHLRYRDFKWLTEDMGLFELPEDWDPQFNNDQRTQSH